MVSRMKVVVHVHPDLDRLSQAATRSFAERITATVARDRVCSVALPGGSTPRHLYQLLATQYRDEVPWDRVWLFWGDERYVPYDDPQSNYRLVQETLLQHISIPAGNVHPMPTDWPDPDEAARVYEKLLRSRFSSAWPCFDLVLLGLGADGHIASIFPGSPVFDEPARWVMVARAPVSVSPPVRLTLTLPVINHARCVFFLVSGAEKADAVRRALAGPPDPRACPASAVRPAAGVVVWWVDEQAAKFIPDSVRTR